jgi:hypothetical protein
LRAIRFLRSSQLFVDPRPRVKRDKSARPETAEFISPAAYFCD